MFGKKRIYLDAAAGVTGNPSSPHTEGRETKEKLEAARTQIARLLEVQSDDVLFTSGGTESNALAILGHVRALKEKGRKDIHILYLPSAHASVVGNVALVAGYGVTAEPLPIKDCRVDIEAMKLMIRENTAFITMDAVCGETGVIWNTREVATAIQDKGIVLHVDASQAPLTEKITRGHFGAHMISLDASKISTARGIGALISHRTIPLLPIYVGGGQERGIRSGSEAPELAKAFADGLTGATKERETFRTRAEKSREALVTDIRTNLPVALINEGRAQVPNILNLSLPHRDTDYLVALLDEAGFAVSTRSACETDSEEGSRAVYALFGDMDRAKSTLRISWGPSVTTGELQRFRNALIEGVRFIDSDARR